MSGLAKIEFKEWADELDDPKYLVYIISGGHHWTKEFMGAMKEKFKTDYEVISKKVKDNTKKLNYKSLGKRKHLMMFESIERISKEDMNELVEYIKKPSKHAIFVVSLRHWQEKRELMKNFRYIENSKTIKFFELDFPSRDFVKNFIRLTANNYGLNFDSQDTFNFLVRRLSQRPDTVVDNIYALSVIGKNVDKEMVKTYTEDYSSYNYDKLYDTLVKLNRKRVPFVSYNDLIEAGRNEVTILINTRKHFQYLLEAKYLKLGGILRNDDLIDIKKHLYDKGDIKFQKNNIWDLPEYKINYYLRQCDHISLKEIINILQIIDFNMPSITFIPPKENENLKPVREPKTRPFKTILDILNRRNDTTMI